MSVREDAENTVTYLAVGGVLAGVLGYALALSQWPSEDEYADHGRPWGGREGGELSDQPPQPQRPDYAAERASEQDEDDRSWEVRNG